MNKYMAVQECASDSCSGWKGPDECPKDGKFDPEHSACQECEKDALEAFDEAMRGGEITR